jgi:hypothetical protein
MKDYLMYDPERYESLLEEIKITKNQANNFTGYH